MQQKITNFINSPEFQNTFNVLDKSIVSPAPQVFTLNQLVNNPSIKVKGGIYFLHSDNQLSLYKKEALWYVGITGTSTLRDRVLKHYARAIGTFNLKHNTIVPSFDYFENWLNLRGHGGKNGIWQNNCQVLWYETVNLTKGEIEYLELKCIMSLDPILNKERFSIFGVQELNSL